MKISQRKITLIAAIAIILLTVGKMNFFTYHPDKSFGVNSYTTEDSDLDSLEFGIRDAENKLNRLRREKEFYLTGFEMDNFLSIGPLGIQTITMSNNAVKHKRDYLQLGYIGINYDDTIFHDKTYLAYQIKNGQPYLITKKLIKSKNDAKVVNVYKKVNFLYSPKYNSILIPINTSFWKICIYMICVGLGLLTITLCLFVIVTFFNFLLEIAKDHAFTSINVNRLRDMAIVLFILATFQHVINFIIYCIFILSYGTEDIAITKSFFEAEYFAIIFAILCYLLYTAFKKAMTLQQENELTI